MFIECVLFLKNVDSCIYLFYFSLVIGFAGSLLRFVVVTVEDGEDLW